MTLLTVVTALFGGMLIGLAAAILLFFNNRTAGISGIAAGLIKPWKQNSHWRLSFVIGLVISAPLWRLLIGNISIQINTPLIIRYLRQCSPVATFNCGNTDIYDNGWHHCLFSPSFRLG